MEYNYNLWIHLYTEFQDLSMIFIINVYVTLCHVKGLFVICYNLALLFGLSPLLENKF